MIDIRKLVALDMVLHGTRFIIGEFIFGVAIGILLGSLAIRGRLFGDIRSGWTTVAGYWLMSIGINYVPLLVYAVSIARRGSAQAEGKPELAYVKRYSLQQFIIFIPFLVVILALVQEIHRRQP